MTSLAEQATTAFNNGDLTSASVLYKRLLDSGEDELVALNGLALVAYYQGDFPTALHHRTAQLAILRTQQRESAMTGVLINLGAILLQLGQYADAIPYLDEALTLTRQYQNDAHRALTLNLMGGIVMRQGDYEKACGHFEESIAIHRQMQDVEQLAATLSNLGLTRLAIDMPDIAYQHLTESLTLAHQLDNPRLLSSILAKMGQVLYKRGDLSAQTYLQESLTIRRNLEDTRHVIDSLSLLAIVTQQTDYLIEAMQLAIQLDNDPATLEVLVALAYHEAHQGKFDRSAQILACVNTHPAKTDFTYPLYIQPLITQYALQLPSCDTENIVSFIHAILADFLA